MNQRDIKKTKKQLSYLKRQQRIIKYVIKKYGGRLHQKDFDKEFANSYKKNGKVYRPKRMFGWVPMHMAWLGSLYQGDWSRWLDLTQLMVTVSKLKREGKLPNVYYCLV